MMISTYKAAIEEVETLLSDYPPLAIAVAADRGEVIGQNPVDLSCLQAARDRQHRVGASARRRAEAIDLLLGFAEQEAGL